ncbi:MAG: hypothetical protein VKO39_08230 [Cyanobacteriota bacterium]|nr:hypothetical protein [Cyanobacteriota bacterium]
MALMPLLLGLTLFGEAFPGGGVQAEVRRAGPLAMTSPWWENYDVKERYLCTERGGVVLERNDAQAALISGGTVTTLFRESSEGPALVYRNDSLRLILRGDELTLERLPMTITCVRSEQV